jgi:hypothetical protein
MSSAERAGDSLIGLKKFSGLIIRVVDSRKGLILLNDLGLEVTFLPSIIDETGTERRFTSDDINASVDFNLVFTYSGLRAWNVTKAT